MKANVKWRRHKMSANARLQELTALSYVAEIRRRERRFWQASKSNATQENQEMQRDLGGETAHAIWDFQLQSGTTLGAGTPGL
jgi:hypothetical protein